MTSDQLEEIIERTAQRTAEKLREEMRSMFTALGFNMDPDKIHEEQQMVAFVRTMHKGTQYGIRTIFAAVLTAAVGWVIWLFTGKAT